MSRFREPDIADFTRVTTALFSAAIGRASWNDFLACLAEHAEGVRTQIIGYDDQTGLAVDMAEYGYDPGYIETYREHYAALNAWAPGFMSKPIGAVIDSEEMCPIEELKKTEFYHDWLRPQEDIIQGGGALLFHDATRVFALGGNIRERDAETMKEPWLRTVGYLIPHLRQAFDVSRALAGAKLETMIVAREGLRSVPGIAILAGDGRLVFANTTAETMLEEGHPIAADWKGRLVCGRGNQRLSDIAMFRLASRAASFTIDVPGDDGATWQLRFTRFHLLDDLPPLLAHAMEIHGQCLLLLASRMEKGENPAADIAQALGLTQSEAEVALLVADGLSSREISERRSVSVNTARNQVQSAMTKLGVRRRTELVKAIQKVLSGS
jgi:DNA-binding CsgD family transcriptional regulator